MLWVVIVRPGTNNTYLQDHILLTSELQPGKTSSVNLGSSAAVHRCCRSDTKLSRIPNIHTSTTHTHTHTHSHTHTHTHTHKHTHTHTHTPTHTHTYTHTNTVVVVVVIIDVKEIHSLVNKITAHNNLSSPIGCKFESVDIIHLEKIFDRS